MHEHIQCEHEIKYCNICDVCYCEKCNKEWNTWKITYNSPTIWVGDSTSTYPNIKYETIGHNHGKELE